MAMVRIYHPTTKAVTDVPEQSVPVLEKSGWTTEVPKKHQTDDSKEA